ncbi:MAG: TAXI family TRAP transporter solute-binding subunit [Thiolinea sp.]
MRHIQHFLVLVLLFSIFNLARASCPNKFFDESCSCLPPQNGYCITAGSKKFTYYKIAEDLKQFVAPDAGIELKVMEGESVKNIKRMRWQHGVKLSIIQSDVLEFYKAEQKNGNPVAAQIIKPLRAVMPLYNEEVHILVKAKSGIETFSDLKDKKVAVGRLTSGPAVTMKSLYQHVFNEEMASDNIHYTPEGVDSIDDGLGALANDSVDAWVMVVGQGTERIAAFLPEAAKHFKFVKFDANNAQEKQILNGPYFTATIRKDSYPWLEEDVPTITTKAILITQRYTNPTTKKNIRLFTQSFCKNFARLQAEGNPKWQEVKLERIKLPGDWQYSKDAIAAFDSDSCNLKEVIPGVQAQANDDGCSSQEAVLNLCVAEE